MLIRVGAHGRYLLWEERNVFQVTTRDAVYRNEIYIERMAGRVKHDARRGTAPQKAKRSKGAHPLLSAYPENGKYETGPVREHYQ